MNPLAVFDFRAGLNGDDVSEADAQVVADDAIEADLVVANRVVGENDANGLATFFA